MCIISCAYNGLDCLSVIEWMTPTFSAHNLSDIGVSQLKLGELFSSDSSVSFHTLKKKIERDVFFLCL